MRELFYYRSYKKYLKDFIASTPKSGVVSDLAQGAGCNRSYFSQVLNSKAQLTADHAVNLSAYLGFSAEENEFFLLLTLLERSADSHAKKIFEEKVESLAREHLLVSKKVRSGAKVDEIIEESHRHLYYSSWIYAAVHLLTSGSEYRSSERIAKRLNIDLSKAKKVINDLKSMGLVVGVEGSYKHSGAEIHIEKDSIHTQQKHLNWRLRAVEKSREENSMSYSAVFTISKKDYPKLQEQLLSFIGAQRKAISESGSEELVCFNCDLFVG